MRTKLLLLAFVFSLLPALSEAAIYRITCSSGAPTAIFPTNPDGSIKSAYATRKTVTLFNTDTTNSLSFCDGLTVPEISATTACAASTGFPLAIGQSFTDTQGRGQMYCIGSGGSAQLTVLVR